MHGQEPARSDCFSIYTIHVSDLIFWAISHKKYLRAWHLVFNILMIRKMCRKLRKVGHPNVYTRIRTYEGSAKNDKKPSGRTISCSLNTIYLFGLEV